MSSSRTVTSDQTSPLFSRRRFAGMAFAGAAAGLLLPQSSSAQEPGVLNEQVAYQPVPQSTSTQSTSETTSSLPSGQFIADFALQFVGYPYVYAGNTPSGFDCSGFTQYVILNTLGIDIGHGTAGQVNFGTWVDYGAWLPGDLVYFAGTYAAGISHAGVSIGDGQMVHAENEGTGVTISSIYSDYYTGHYYGAIRLV